VPCESRKSSLSRVSLLCHHPDGPYVSEVRHCLEALDVAVDVCHFGQALSPQHEIISLLDLQEPVLHGMSEETFKIAKGYLTSHKASILWMMPASQVGDVNDPRAAIVLGLARTARNELALPFYTIETDETTSAVAVASAVARILNRVKSENLRVHESMNPDYEYAIIKGEILIPRLHWQTMSAALQQSTPASDWNKTDDLTADWCITMKTPGLLHTMTWSKGVKRLPVEGELLVETRALGLNFRVRIIDPWPRLSNERLYFWLVWLDTSSNSTCAKLNQRSDSNGVGCIHSLRCVRKQP
jgi:hypothetical protein